MSPWRAVGFLCFLGCAHVPEASPPQERSRATAHYTVTIYDNFGGARVRTCLKGMTVRGLVPIDDGGGRALRRAWIGDDPLDTAHGRIRLREPSRAACVDYETRFDPPMFRASDPAAVIVSQAQWLWRPDPFPRDLEASVRFELPVDGEVSLPWPRSDSTYFPEQSAFYTSAYGVFGSFEYQSFSVVGTSVEVARLGPWPPADEIRRWLGRALQATASVGGRFPHDRVHFIIIPTPSQDKHVVFGMVRRGGGSSVLLLPSPNATVGELESDWVAVHELSHLWLPHLYPGDRWITEGIATYLQEVLRARCGLQSSERAWTRLQEGFERGRRAGTGRPLASESREMSRTGAYHRVYWAGAAFALAVDVRLRKNSNGEMTLLRAISDGQRVWGTDARLVDGSALLSALQEASGADFIQELAETYAANSDFPSIEYVRSPEYREIRTQILSGADEACGLSAESSR